MPGALVAVPPSTCIGLNFVEVSIHRAVVLGLFAGGTAGLLTGTRLRILLLGLLIDLLADGVESLLQIFLLRCV